MLGDLCALIDMGNVTSVDDQSDIEITVDSGAGDTVAPPTAFPWAEVKPSEKSKRGAGYLGAGGERIANLGELSTVLGVEGGPFAKFRFQAANVRKPLLSVSASNDKGNMVIFDEDGSFILPKGTAELKAIRALIRNAKLKIPLKRKNGVFTMTARRADRARPRQQQRDGQQPGFPGPGRG